MNKDKKILKEKKKWERKQIKEEKKRVNDLKNILDYAHFRQISQFM